MHATGGWVGHMMLTNLEPTDEDSRCERRAHSINTHDRQHHRQQLPVTEAVML
jgi:hypothetical protein